jgi:hypothetical protein
VEVRFSGSSPLENSQWPCWISPRRVLGEEGD